MTTIRMSALEVRNRAIMSRSYILGIRDQMVAVAVKGSLEKVCTHKFCGFTYYKHKMFPTTEHALEHSPFVRFAQDAGKHTVESLDRLLKAAEWVLATVDEDNKEHVMALSITDFELLGIGDGE